MELAVITVTAALAVSAVILLLIWMKKYLYNLIDRRIERFQSELIEKQVNEIENMYKQVRGWRHDYRNHIQNMKIQLAEGNYEALNSYLDSLADDLTTVDTVIKTGNVMADAILNSKLSIAQKLNIKLNVKANIPKHLTLSDVELCAVMGNLLDNAAEACAKLPESERFMRIYIGTLKNQFYLSVQNSAGEVRKSGNEYRSTKGENHGYGIFRIDRIAKKYGGYVNRQNEEGIFATEIMLPLEP
ncbi:GHKL domain-containing protein [Ruminococcus sp. Marseille-P6503]|uniref:sensor histidine kinase n=1 Tax=Ruminococcus sp. Marseille-P6503 TaxID=2364796 RepID=UPI001FAA906D|nr:GHKL domain-containing protein [Ruminococcus sp. Marseille-P6503]